MNSTRLGVVLCECGGQIASVLDIDSIEQEVCRLPGVAVVQRQRYACSPDGLSGTRSAITENGLERVVIGACVPRVMAPRLRQACADVGIDRDLCEVVDIREGCAWVHGDEPQEATHKAVDLLHMGIAAVARRKGRRPFSVDVVPAALVIGGGLAGITAALTLADAGVPVKLVERGPALGGRQGAAHTLPDRGGEATDFLASQVEAVTQHPKVKVFLSSRVVAVSGTVGQYVADIRNSVGQSDSDTKAEVGAIIVATGARVWQPRGLFRYDGKRVLTQCEFERCLAEAAPGGRWDGDGAAGLDAVGDGPGDVVMILCAGRGSGSGSYCSGICCMTALKQAVGWRALCPDGNVTILYRDWYLPDEPAGHAELARAQQAGVRFVRYAPESPPTVEEQAVVVHDELRGSALRLPYGRVVLATPLVPQADASVLAHMLDLPVDSHGFFPDVRYRLRPENQVERGIYVCGAAHRPAPWRQVQFEAVSAAFRALRLIEGATLTTHAPVALVDEGLCTGCATCVKSCAFQAISMRRREGVLDVSSIDPMLCKGCGSCVVACPVKAIDLPVGGSGEIVAQIDAALADGSRNGQLRVLAFGCEWSSHAAAELAGAGRLAYPSDIRLIRMGCSARMDPIHILWALVQGADGVFLGACPPGECHYVDGNHHAQERFENLRRLLCESGFDERRVRLEWIVPDEPRSFVDKITDFARLISALGPSPARSH